MEQCRKLWIREQHYNIYNCVVYAASHIYVYILYIYYLTYVVYAYTYYTEINICIYIYIYICVLCNKQHIESNIEPYKCICGSVVFWFVVALFAFVVLCNQFTHILQGYWMGAMSFRFSQGQSILTCNNLRFKAEINFIFLCCVGMTSNPINDCNVLWFNTRGICCSDCAKTEFFTILI